MKKKVLTTLALVLLVAMCALTFAACAPTSVGKYIDALKKSEYIICESNNDGDKMIIEIDGANMHMKFEMDGTVTEVYVITDGDKKTAYMLEDKKWIKSEDKAEIDGEFNVYSIKTMTDALSSDESKYDIKDGVWTDKVTKLSYEVKKGKLVVSKDSKEMNSMSLTKPRIKLPAAAKDAKVA